MNRSAKKVTGGEDDSCQPVCYADLFVDKGKKSYRDSVLGGKEGKSKEKEGYTSRKDGLENDLKEEEDGEITVEEGTFDRFDCPKFILSEKDGVIVKLLGRKIGFKALETRLKQIWVRRGIITVIDFPGNLL